MRWSATRHLSSKIWLQNLVLLAIGTLAALALGAAAAYAAGEEEGGGGPIEPVIVEVEAQLPSTPKPTESTTTTPTTTAPAPKPSEPVVSAPSGGTTHTTAPTHTVRSGGSSSHATVNNSVRGPSSGDPGPSTGSNGGGGGESTGSSGSNVTSTPTSASTPTSTSTAAPTSTVEKAAADLVHRAGGGAAGGDKKSRQDAVKDLGKALGTAILGNRLAVSHPEKKHAAFFAPLAGKDKLPYVLLILAIALVVALIIAVQFTNPQRLRYWRARFFGIERAAITARPRRRPPSPGTPRPGRLRTAERPRHRGTARRDAPHRKAA
jgi:hypothetical protein